jgi:hypothetical protein
MDRLVEDTYITQLYYSMMRECCAVLVQMCMLQCTDGSPVPSDACIAYVDHSHGYHMHASDPSGQDSADSTV